VIAGSDRANYFPIAFMRLRVLSVPPLPDLKAWFSTNPLDHLATVSDLKKLVCSRIPALDDANIQDASLVFVLDDFELLNESGIDVVRDGDLIHIKLLSGLPIIQPASRESQLYVYLVRAIEQTCLGLRRT
jgi:hypothetical protein